eukprot:COSAG05_NODE_1257_length_5359_cov_5.368251_3_plen_153_part_00
MLKENPEPDAPIADLFIDKVLKYAVKRIKATIPEEKTITLAEMKQRAVGKADYSCRSCLHDDITVIIIQFTGLGVKAVASAASAGGAIAEGETPLSSKAGGGSAGSADVRELREENAALKNKVMQLEFKVMQLERALGDKATAVGVGEEDDV